ncbi:7044_t:CDS:1, partial [Dentiscutata heterogama]
TKEITQAQTKSKSKQINQKNSFTPQETQINFSQEIYIQTQEIQEKNDFKKRKVENQADNSEMDVDLDYKINEIDEEMELLKFKKKELEIEKRMHELTIEKNKLKRKRDT